MKPEDFDMQVARLWEAVETKLMKREEFYPHLIDHLVREGYLNKESNILCAATGHGPLYCLLLEQGYDVYGNDGSTGMIERMHKRMQTMGLKHRHEFGLHKWRYMGPFYSSALFVDFDLIFTEGNSLIYAGTWAEEEPNLERAMHEIEISILVKSQILNEYHGIWYVEIPKEDEEEEIREVKGIIINGKKVDLRYSLHDDWEKRIRTFIMEEVSGEDTLSVTQKALLLTGKELEEMCVPKYFSSMERIDLNDPHYQGYVLKK